MKHFWLLFALSCSAFLLAGCYTLGYYDTTGTLQPAFGANGPILGQGGIAEEALYSVGGITGALGLWGLRTWRRAQTDNQELKRLAKEAAEEPDTSKARKLIIDSKVEL